MSLDLELFETFKKQLQFDSNCIKLLCSHCSNSSQYFNTFKLFISRILDSEEGFNKIEALLSIQESVHLSQNFLDAFLAALYEWNFQKKNGVSSLINGLNNDLPKNDWSHLRQITILKPYELCESQEINRGSELPIDKCIYEIIFTHTSPYDLSKSQFVSIPINSTLKLLTKESLNNFADALIFHFQNPTEIFNKIELVSNSLTCETENWLAQSIFRSRNEDINDENSIYSILENSFTINQSQRDVFNELIQRVPIIFKELGPNNYKNDFLTFFNLLILPYADYFDDAFIQEIIHSSIFPSDNPQFLASLFLKSGKCRKFITIEELFDIFEGDEPDDNFLDSFNDAYKNIVVSGDSQNDEMYRTDSVLKQIYKSFYDRETGEPRLLIARFFLWFIENSDNLTPTIMCQSIASYINEYDNAICALVMQAIENDSRLDLFIHLNTLLVFFQHSFSVYFPLDDDKSKDSLQSLHIISTISIKYTENEIVQRFWIENIGFMFDAIYDSHPLTALLISLMNTFFQNASKDFIEQLIHIFSDPHDMEIGNEPVMNLITKFLKS